MTTETLRRRSWRTTVPQAEAGFTIVELMICLTILAVAIFALASVTVSAVKLTGTTGNRTRAEAIASREIEALKAIPYGRLGFPASPPAPSGGFGTTVVVSNPPSPQVLPTESDTFGGLTFTTSRFIVWADGPIPAIGTTPSSIVPNAFKRTIVEVSWTDEVGPHEIRQDSNIYPSGSGLYSTTTTTSPPTGTPLPPSGLVASAPPSTTDAATRVDLTWVPPASGTAVSTWAIEWSADDINWSRVTDSHPAASTAFSVTGLSPSTPYFFRVFSRSSAGAESAAIATTSSITTLSLASPTCAVSSAAITRNAIYRTSTGKVLVSNPYLAVNTLGGCSTGVQVQYRPESTTPSLTLSLLPVTPGSRVFALSLDGASTAWDIGKHQLLITTPANTVLSQVSFTVCTRNAPTCP